MGGLDISSTYDSMILQVPVDTGVDIELRITYLSHQGVVLEVIAPGEFAEDVTAWIASETGLRFSYRELPKIIGELPLEDGICASFYHTNY